MHLFNKRTNLILQTKKRAKKLHVNRFRTMIFLYGIALAALIEIMKFVEYSYFIRDFSIEVFVGVVAALFTGLGIWVGLKLINRRKEVETAKFVKDEKVLKLLKISKSEYEVLQLISKGTFKPVNCR